jgi:ferredoxin-NADP reductase
VSTVPAPPDDRLTRNLQRLGSLYAWTSRRYERRLPPHTPIYPVLDLVVDEVRPEADDVLVVRFRDVGGTPLPSWSLGSHLDLTLPSGRRRQYSLCGDPSDRSRYQIAVRRLPAGLGGSVEVHDVMRAGVRLPVRGPLNAFPLIKARSYVFVAGGIGITPVLPMVESVARSGAAWRFVYTGRTRASMPFLDRVAVLDPSRVTIRPDDESGRPAVGELLGDVGPDGAVYCCGPAPMLDAVVAEVHARGEGSVHTERFSAPPVVDGKPLDVHLARHGTTLHVPADRSVLAVVREAVPEVGYSCQQGFCGTCKVAVLGGEVDHRDGRLTDAERAAGDMLICVSRSARGALTLDL